MNFKPAFGLNFYGSFDGDFDGDLLVEGKRPLTRVDIDLLPGLGISSNVDDSVDGTPVSSKPAAVASSPAAAAVLLGRTELRGGSLGSSCV